MNIEELLIVITDFLGCLIRKSHSFYLTVNEEVKLHCEHVDPLLIIILTILFTILAINLWSVIFPENGIEEYKLKFWWVVRRLPFLKQIIDKKMAHFTQNLEKDLRKEFAGLSFYQELPKIGLDQDEVLSQVEEYGKQGNVTWDKGRASGTVYKNNDKHLIDLVTKVYGVTAWTNPLHFDVFPGICKMEAEVTRMVCSLFNGSSSSCGTVSSGGTESIFLACKAYRDYAYEEKGITKPEMIVPVTAHAAFDKSAQMLKIRLFHIPIGKDMKVNVRAMKRAITSNTIMLVGSSPQFPHGIIDPITEIAKLGTRYNIPVHVDACLGGMLLPFMKDAGYPIPEFDFSVDGVTSISCDTHKYGYAPKGSSVIMYSDKKYLHHQFSVTTNWPGGIYGTPNLGGSRAGGIIAATWATMLFHGYEGYRKSCKSIIDTTKSVLKGINNIDGIFVYGDPQISVISIGSDVFNIYALTDNLAKKGWNLNILQNPQAFHICLTLQHTEGNVAQEFLKDLEECVEHLKKNPTGALTGNAAMYGTAQKIPDKSLIKELTWAFLDACYSTKPVE